MFDRSRSRAGAMLYAADRTNLESFVEKAAEQVGCQLMSGSEDMHIAACDGLCFLVEHGEAALDQIKENPELVGRMKEI